VVGVGLKFQIFFLELWVYLSQGSTLQMKDSLTSSPFLTNFFYKIENRVRMGHEGFSDRLHLSVFHIPYSNPFF
jgi:hypothetical protein